MLVWPYSCLYMMNWFVKSSLFFLEKIKEAQKELNGAEVSKKGKLKPTPI